MQRAVIVTLVLTATATAVMGQAPWAAEEVTCPGGQQTCGKNEPCCAFDPGSYGCCSSTETCCSDDRGGECCIVQTTYCVQKDDAENPYPARCCPRFTVGCNVGTVGCCDPAISWQRGAPVAAAKAKKVAASSTQMQMQVQKDSKNVAGTNAAAVHILFDPGNGKLKSVSINATSGAVLNTVDVPGYNTWGEDTRDFAFSPRHRRFYMFDVDYNGDAKQITMSAINPDDGSTKTTKLPISDIEGEVYGYFFDHEMSKFVVSTLSNDGSSWEFFTVDPSSGKVAKLQGSVPRGKKDSDPNFYAGYFRLASSGTETYRLGYKDVTNQASPGLGRTSIASGTTVWEQVPMPMGHGFYFSATRHSPTSNFISLSTNASSGFLDVVMWNTSTAEVIASLGNAAPPRTMGKGELGFEFGALSADGSVYAALVDHTSPIPIPFPGALDTWSIVVGHVASRNFVTLPITPAALESTEALSGIGITLE